MFSLKTFVKILIPLLGMSVFSAGVTHAQVWKAVSCITDSYFGNTNGQCFLYDNLYLGDEYHDFSDTVYNDSDGAPIAIYRDENKNPVTTDWFYTDGSLLRNLTFNWVGPLYNQDDGYGDYAYLATGADKKIIQSTSDSYIKFDKLTNEIKKNKRTKPLFRLQYTWNYWNTVTWDGLKQHQQTVIVYPAFCGDGVIDKDHGETCDDGDANGTAGKCNTVCSGPTKTPVNAVCGGDNGKNLDNNPSNLCSTGKAGSVSLSGSTYSWSCDGIDGGNAVSCSAGKKVPAVCGSDNGKTLGSAPSNLCQVGTAGTISGSGPWTWSCTGINGGSNVSCNAEKKKDPVDGICGSSDGKIVSSQPKDNLCSKGTASGISGNGPWTWSCAGTDGGKAVSCEAKKESTPNPADGICGSSDGTTSSAKPTTNLCSRGTAGAVSGSGPWTWSCAGTDGGKAVSCEAKKESTPVVCDQTFYDTLRVGMSYSFPDALHNNNTYSYILSNFSVKFTESDDMNEDGKSTFDNFLWYGSWGPGKELQAKTSADPLIYAFPKYFIKKQPQTRKTNNISLVYTVGLKANGKDISHNECLNYAVTWCGDGVVDTNYGEKCDPSDPAKAGWGKGGCSATCEPKDTSDENGLSIKKTIDGKDANTATDAAKKKAGETVTYKLTVTNTTTKTYTGATVKDNMPAALENIAASGTDWTCTVTGQLVKCDYKKTIAPNATLPAITVTAKIKTTTPNGTKIKNVGCVYDSTKTDCDASICQPNDPNYNPTTNSCDPVVIEVGDLDLTITKYAKEITSTGDSNSAPVELTYGETFNYYYVFENTTNNTIKNVKIADTFPESLVWASGKNITVENAQGQDVTSDWTITKGTYNGTSRITLLMSKKTPLLANSGKFKVTVPVTVPSNAKSDTQMKNVVYICAEGVNAPKGPNGENIDCTTPPPPPPTECTPENNPHKDPACIIVKNQADLVIKKYVKTIDTTGDSQSAPINVTPGETFNYYYQFYNTGSVAIKNVVIKDTLPEYLSHTGNILVKDATGKDVTSDWTITRSTKKFDDGKDHIYLIMKKKTDLPAKSGVYTVTVPVTISSTVPKNLSLQNMAYICGDNTVGTPTGPNGENVCGNDNPPPPPPPGQCTPENNPYKDPACIVVPPDTPTGSTQYKAYYCATSDLVSSTADFSSLAACNDHRTYLKTKGWNDNQIGQCDPTTDFTSDRIAHEKATLLPLCTGVNPICGDGILDTKKESCDLGSNNGKPGYNCTIQCTLIGPGGGGSSNPPETPTTETNPGAVKWDYFYRIPKLSNVNFGGDFRMDNYGIVIGQNTPIFTIADEIQLRMVPAVNGAVAQIPARKVFCLKKGDSTNAISGNPEACQEMQGVSGSTPEYWTRSDGVKFYTIGIGEFLMDKDANTSPNIECSLPGAQYKVCHVRGASENSQYQFTLFKGSEKYNNTAGAMSSVALFEKFLGGTPTQTGKLTLYGCSLDSNFTTSDCSASRISDIVSMNIKVSSAVVGTTSSPVSRTTQIFKGVDLGSFLGEGKVLGSTVTNTTINTPSQATAVTPIKANITKSAPVAPVKTVSDLSSYVYNGNSNIYAMTGTLIIDNCANNTFEMTGVKTVLVEGNIILKCNVSYPSGDTTSSWAWIAKRGNILVDTSVTSLAGVYVALSENQSGKGQFQSNNGATANILKIDGTLYGDATSLFNSRTYARGTNAYDILTTGTILSYSNRALVNPPPLLSQYLNNYKVQRVVK